MLIQGVYCRPSQLSTNIQMIIVPIDLKQPQQLLKLFAIRHEEVRVLEPGRYGPVDIEEGAPRSVQDRVPLLDIGVVHFHYDLRLGLRFCNFTTLLFL